MPFWSTHKAKETPAQGHVPTLPDLAAVQISWISAIAYSANAPCHPVFVVDYSGGSVVVKGEKHHDAQVKKQDLSQRHEELAGGVKVEDEWWDESARWAGKIMYNVCGYTKVSLLTGAEKSALKGVPYTRFMPTELDRKACAYLHFLIDGRPHAQPPEPPRYMLYKMPFVRHLHGMASMAKDSSSCLAMLEKLSKDRKVLYNLARVIAVDMFIGNHDRFNADGAVANPENVLFIMEGNKLSPVGVDFFDKTSAADEFHIATTDSILLLPPRPDWAGTMLANRSQLNEFAVKLLDGLNRYFSKTLKGLGIPASEGMLIDKIRLGDIAKGLLDGANGLREYLQRRRRQKKVLPVGVGMRMQRLGW